MICSAATQVRNHLPALQVKMRLHLEEKERMKFLSLQVRRKSIFQCRSEKEISVFPMFWFMNMSKVMASCAWAVSRNAGSWMRYTTQPAGMPSFVMTMLLTRFIQINVCSKVFFLLYKNRFCVFCHYECYCFFLNINTRNVSALSKKPHVFVRSRGHFSYHFFNSVLSAVTILLGKW